MTRRKLFISYSHADAQWLMLIREHLSVLEAEGLVEAVDDSVIQPGEDWYAKLDREMLESNIALLMISASYLSSLFVRKEEIPRLINRHKLDGMSLYPLLLKDCAWQEVSWLRQVQLRPLNNRPVLSFKGAARDKCLADVAREIACILKSWGEKPGTVEFIDTRQPPGQPAEFRKGSEITTVINWLPPLPSTASGDGIWVPQIYLESMGPGPELTFPVEPIPESSVQSFRPDGSFQYELKIPAGFTSPGVYKPLVTLQYIGSSGATPSLMGWIEGPVISVIE